MFNDIKNYVELMVTQGVLPIFSTARNERNREDTEKKLKAEHIPFFKLYMRKEGDYRPSAEVKKEHLTDIQKRFNIVLFIDDDITNIKMAEGLGISSIKIPREDKQLVEEKV